MRRKLVLVGLVFAALAVGGWVLARELRASEERWVQVARQDLVIDVTVEGELKATESTNIGPPAVSGLWNFKIAFMAPEGAEVQAGQPVLGFDTTDLRRRLDQRKAERDAAEKELEKATTDFEIERRDKELALAEASARLRRADLKLAVPENVASSNELGQARIDRRLALLEVESQTRALANLGNRSAAELEALRQTRDRRALQVTELERQIGLMTIAAPRAGTVIYRSRRGEKSKVGDSAYRGQTVIEIPDLAVMLAEGVVDEADAGRVAVGQPVTLRLDSHPDQVYQGKVAAIRRAVQRRSRVNPEKVVRLAIDLAATDTERMRPGMRFRGTIEVARVADALTVPEDAVFAEPGGLAVQVRGWGGRRTVRPTFGARNAEVFSVTDGLRDGDWVLLRSTAAEAGP